MEKLYAYCYQELFNLMANEHNLVLTKPEMDEIIRASKLVVANIENLESLKLDFNKPGTAQ